MPDQGLLFAHNHDDLPEPGEAGLRCTPELLWEFIRETRARTGKSPTLLDCKGRFGGILGPLVCGWELERRGLMARSPKLKE